jgi:hypothetical protein
MHTFKKLPCMKKIYLPILLVINFLAYNQIQAQFPDCYGEQNWTIDISNTGPNNLEPGVVFDNDGGTITFTADGDFQGLSIDQPAGFPFDCSADDGLVMACITILADGMVSFDWNYTMQLFFEDPANEPFGYCLNGDNFISFVTAGVFENQSGTANISVSAGDELCLVQASYFSEEFQAVTTVSEFSAPSPTAAPVFVSTSSHPIIGAWVDGHVTLTDGTSTFEYDVTEFDNIIADVPFGFYNYTFSQTGGCFEEVTGTIEIDCGAIIPESGNVLLSIIDQGTELTSAPVFVLTSNHPIIGSWVDGHVSLTDGTNTFEYDVTEFDNIIADVPFGTYDYTFSQTGGCYPEVTGSLVVDCDAISPQSGNVLLNIIDLGEPSQTTAPVFVSTSSHPIIGAWVDGYVTLTNGFNSYEYNVTEFDNIIPDVAMGTYTYTFMQAGGCYPEVTGTLTVDCDAIIPQSGNVLLSIIDQGTEITAAPVFVSTSSHPIIGAWIDGHVTLTDGTNNFEYDVTEFDNIIADVPFGTYDYTFSQAGGCFKSVSGTLIVDCDAIIPQSGNVLLSIIDLGTELTSAPVFVLTSNHPIIGSWVDGHVSLTDGTNTFEYDVTEFDNIIADVPFGTYDYTFSQTGGCYPEVTGSLVVDCDAISPQSGNVLLSIIDLGEPSQTTAPVFVSTSSHPIIGAWVDGHVTLTDGFNTYEYNVTEFDNIIADVAMGTYTYTFTQAGGCYKAVTGTLTVDCNAIIPESGNVLLSIIDQGSEITAAPVFVSTSNHPIIGSWVDGHVTLTDGTNTFEYDVTEFDNIITDVPFGTYDYTFSQTGGCYPEVTGSLIVDCDAISPQSGNVLLSIIDLGEPSQTTAPVFVSTSSHPIIGAWVDGHVTLTDGFNTYEYNVTEFDNIIADVAMGTYTYTFVQAGGCYKAVTGTLTVDCDAIIPQSGNVLLSIIDQGTEITAAPVFVSTSSHPIIGAWVDGHVTLTDGTNTFEYDVTEFDNIIADVPFGTYNYTFSQAGGCYPDVTGMVTVDCDAIIPQSGNVLLSIIDQGTEITAAPVFVSTSSHPIIGAWVDGHVTLTDGTNTFEYDVTEFDNIIVDVPFGTYNYTFSQAGGCYPDVTGMVTVDCDAIIPQSGNVLLSIIDQGTEITAAPVFVSTSSHPIIGAWVDGHVTLTDGTNTFEYDVTEFDNIIVDVPFGTYNYTFSQAGGCYPDVTGMVTVDCDAIIPQSGNVLLSIIDQGTEITAAPVFVSTSSHPIIGAWVDGHVTLTDGTNTFEYDVTEFDNIIADVPLGTYSFTFSQAGGCYPDVTGMVTVDCDAIIPQSGNVLLSIIDQGTEITAAPVFVSTSSHPIIGAWVDGHVTLTDGTNTFEYDVTEFDNIIADVPFGTFNFTFSQAGGCYPDVTGMVTVDCDAIIPQSGNVLLSIIDQGTPIEVDTSVSQESNVLTANATGVSYQWVDCNNENAPIEGETNQTFTAMSNGSYAVIITDPDCPDYPEMSTCYEVTSVSTGDLDRSLSLALYPNPVADHLTINLSRPYADIDVQIFTVAGKRVKMVNSTNNSEIIINVAALPSGTYLIKVNADDFIHSSMLVKE